jgi:hypothetical protein
MTKHPVPLLVALSALAAVPAIAAAQEPATPDTTKPTAVLKIDTKLQSIDSMIGGGLTFSADPSEDVTYTGKVTIKVKKKTVVVAKSIDTRNFYNQSGGFIEATFPRASDSAVKKLQQIKKGTRTAVTLTLDLKDTAGNTSTVTKTVKLKKRY